MSHMIYQILHTTFDIPWMVYPIYNISRMTWSLWYCQTAQWKFVCFCFHFFPKEVRIHRPLPLWVNTRELSASISQCGEALLFSTPFSTVDSLHAELGSAHYDWELEEPEGLKDERECPDSSESGHSSSEDTAWACSLWATAKRVTAACTVPNTEVRQLVTCLYGQSGKPAGARPNL